MLSNSSQPPPFSAKKACFIILGVQSVSLQHFYLIQVFFGRRFALPLALCPFLLFFLGILSKLLCFQSLTRKYAHIPRMHWFFTQHSPYHSTMRLFLHDRVPLPLRQRFISFCLQRIVVASLAKIGKIPHPHYRCKLPETEGFFTAPLVTPKQRLSWDVDRAWHETLASERASQHLPREGPTSQMPLPDPEPKLALSS